MCPIFHFLDPMLEHPMAPPSHPASPLRKFLHYVVSTKIKDCVTSNAHPRRLGEEALHTSRQLQLRRIQFLMGTMIGNGRKKKVTFQYQAPCKSYGLIVVDFIAAGYMVHTVLPKVPQVQALFYTRESHRGSTDGVPIPGLLTYQCITNSFNSPANHSRPVDCIPLSTTLFYNSNSIYTLGAII